MHVFSKHGIICVWCCSWENAFEQLVWMNGSKAWKRWPFHWQELILCYIFGSGEVQQRGGRCTFIISLRKGEIRCFPRPPAPLPLCNVASRSTEQCLPVAAGARRHRRGGGSSSAAVSLGSRPPSRFSGGQGRRSSTQGLAGQQARPPPLPGPCCRAGSALPSAPGPAPRRLPLPGRWRHGRRSAASAARAAAFELRCSSRRRRRPGARCSCCPFPTSPSPPSRPLPLPGPIGLARPWPPRRRARGWRRRSSAAARSASGSGSPSSSSSSRPSSSLTVRRRAGDGRPRQRARRGRPAGLPDAGPAGAAGQAGVRGLRAALRSPGRRRSAGPLEGRGAGRGGPAGAAPRSSSAEKGNGEGRRVLPRARPRRAGASEIAGSRGVRPAWAPLWSPREAAFRLAGSGALRVCVPNCWFSVSVAVLLAQPEYQRTAYRMKASILFLKTMPQRGVQLCLFSYKK